jgi:hypothetical protein
MSYVSLFASQILKIKVLHLELIEKTLLVSIFLYLFLILTHFGWNFIFLNSAYQFPKRGIEMIFNCVVGPK